MKAWICAAAVLMATPALAGVKEGQRAEDFELRDLAGKPVKLSQLRGKVVLVDFWASWCGPCKKELPILAAMAKRLKSMGIEILAINVDKKRENVEGFLKANGIDLLRVLLDPEESVVKKYEPPKMPTSFVIDRKGLVRFVNAAFEPGDEAKLEQQLKDLAGK